MPGTDPLQKVAHKITDGIHKVGDKIGTPGKSTLPQDQHGADVAPAKPAEPAKKDDPAAKKDDPHKDPATAPAKTGDKKPVDARHNYLDNGGVCAGGDGSGCFMTKDQRERRVGEFRQRIINASTNYKLAALEVKISHLIKDAKGGDLPLLASLLLDAIGMAAVTGMTKAVMKIVGKGKEAFLDEAAGIAANGSMSWHDNPEAEKSVERALTGWDVMSKINTTQINFITKHVVDGTRKTLEKSATKTSASTPAVDAQKYMSLLSDQAGLSFMALSENSPGLANDAQLIALDDGLDPIEHTQSIYKAQLEDKLARFEASNINNMGRHTEGAVTSKMAQGKTDAKTKNELDDHAHDVGRDRMLVRLQFVSNAPSRYCVAHRDWKIPQAYTTVPANMPMDKGVKQEGLNNGRGTIYWDTDMPGTKPYGLERLVDTDMEDLALSRHEGEWNAAPKWLIIDDRRVTGNHHPADKSFGDYIIMPHPGLIITDPTTWWGYTELRPSTAKY